VLTVDLKESHPMQPRITVVTLGVDDLERALRFYHDGLGLPTEGIIGKELAYGALAAQQHRP
jgi:catechol 2,3-dioxygenase-like lactoylglutathione lyase family enzyme